jgi:site-specific DNA-methyltransferase (adenine-specific)
MFQLHNKDAVAFLDSLAPESVDCLITDAAYESLEKHRAKGTTTRLKISAASSNAWFEIFKDERWPEFFRAARRVLKKNGHLYSFSDQTTARLTAPLGEAADFTWWKWITWDKQRIGMGYHYRNRTELISFFEKGKRRLNDLGLSDVIEVNDLDNGELCADKIDAPMVRGGYPTEKPPEVALPLVLQSTAPGELIVDPFMGSGAFGVAALKCGRSFIGNDLSPAALAYAQPRLVQAKSEFEAKGAFDLVQLKALLKAAA